jgi:pyruvate dehydrogenase E2 component (dihydrolipoamide acetyltransferase)
MVFSLKSSFVAFRDAINRVLMSLFQAQDGAKGIPVGTAIAITAEEGDELSGAADLAKQIASEAPPKAEDSASQESKSEKTDKDSSTKVSSSPETSKAAPGTSSFAELTKSDKKAERIYATPIAKKIALERGIPLAQVKGTGPEGRIIKEDVEKYKGSGGASAGASLAPPTPAPASADQYTDIPVSNIRRVIGQRLTQAKQELPHYYVTVDIDITRVSKLREVFNTSLAGKEGAVKISVNDFIMKACSLALAQVPEVNSAWLGEVIRQ